MRLANVTPPHRGDAAPPPLTCGGPKWRDHPVAPNRLESFLISGPDLGAWSDCWVSVEFLHAPFPRKRSGRTITTIFLMSAA